MNKWMLIAVLFFIIGCDVKSETSSVVAMADSEKVWVFSQFNVEEEKQGLETYFYYGRVSKSLLDAIKNNTLSDGFLLLEDIRYWGDDDLIHEYKDEENTGSILFRIKNIAKMDLIDTPPSVGQGYEQQNESVDDEQPLIETEVTVKDEEL